MPRRVPVWMRWAVGLVLALLPVIWPGLLPVVWSDTDLLPPTLPSWLSTSPLGTSVIGGTIGALLGALGSTVIAGARRRTAMAAPSTDKAAGPLGGHTITASVLVGLSLGWQAAVGVWLLTLALRPLSTWGSRRLGTSEPPTTLLVLAAYLTQLVLWRWSSVSWWPSANTSPAGWAGSLVVVAALCALNWTISQKVSQCRDSPGLTDARRLVT